MVLEIALALIGIRIQKKCIFLIMGDWLGDDSPSCELNVIEKDGGFYGYPYKHAKNVIDPEFGHLIPTLEENYRSNC